MKIDVVIGNPPYQETTNAGNNGGKAIYDLFIYNGLKLSNKLCMIVKNNWLNSDSLKNLRNTMLDNKLKEIVNYSTLGDVFPSMGIAASIVYVDKDSKDYKTHYKELKNSKEPESVIEYSADIRNIGYIPCSEIECKIVNNVAAKIKERFGKYIYATNPFGIGTNLKLSNTKEIIDYSTTKHDYYLLKVKNTVEEPIYVRQTSLPKGKDLLNKYKVICPKQIHKTKNPIPEVMLLNPDEIFSDSYVLVYDSTNLTECQNVVSYIKTKFFRYMTYVLADTLCRLTAYRATLVPDQDFTNLSAADQAKSLEKRGYKIDWSKSISEIDDQLYKKYKLTPDEIQYIEKTIKPME